MHPLLLMIPATLSASCAFMLPVATPPNAIVFGTGEVSMADMMRAGLVLNLVGILLITLAIYTLGAGLLDIDPQSDSGVGHGRLNAGTARIPRFPLDDSDNSSYTLVSHLV